MKSSDSFTEPLKTHNFERNIILRQVLWSAISLLILSSLSNFLHESKSVPLVLDAKNKSINRNENLVQLMKQNLILIEEHLKEYPDEHFDIESFTKKIIQKKLDNIDLMSSISRRKLEAFKRINFLLLENELNSLEEKINSTVTLASEDSFDLKIKDLNWIKTHTNEIKSIVQSIEKKVLSNKSFKNSDQYNILLDRSISDELKKLNNWIFEEFLLKNEIRHLDYNLLLPSNNEYENGIEILFKKIADHNISSFDIDEMDSFNENDEFNLDDKDAFVRLITERALYNYNADKTSLVDYASETLGAKVLVSRCAETYRDKKSFFELYMNQDAYINEPSIVVKPRFSLLSRISWKLKGNKGSFFVKLSHKINPSGFTIEHLPIGLELSDDDAKCAPKLLKLYGYYDEYSNTAAFLGSYLFQINQYEYMKYFAINLNERNNDKDEGKPINESSLNTNSSSNYLVFHVIELKIESNHGNPHYTCLYRFRMHAVTG